MKRLEEMHMLAEALDKRRSQSSHLGYDTHSS